MEEPRDSPQEEFTCSMCHHFTASSIGAVLRHVGSVHAHEAGFKVTCGIQGCPLTYVNYHSFRRHLRRKHTEWIVPDNILEPQQTERSGDAAFGSLTRPGDSMSDSADATSMDSTANYNLAHSLPLFILKNKEIRQISQQALDDLLGDTSLIIEQTVDTLASNISACLVRNGIDMQNIDGLNEVLLAKDLRNPFKGLESSHFQRKAYIELLGLLVSFMNLIITCTCTCTCLHKFQLEMLLLKVV